MPLFRIDASNLEAAVSGIILSAETTKAVLVKH